MMEDEGVESDNAQVASEFLTFLTKFNQPGGKDATPYFRRVVERMVDEDRSLMSIPFGFLYQYDCDLVIRVPVAEATPLLERATSTPRAGSAGAATEDPASSDRRPTQATTRRRAQG
jgi:hypothetical protein